MNNSKTKDQSAQRGGKGGGRRRRGPNNQKGGSKNSGGQGKGQAVTPLAKELPVVPQKIGDAESNAQASAVSRLVAAGQVTSMSGTQTTISVVTWLANSGVYEIARVLATKLAVALPLDSATADTATAWTPAGAMSYLVWALFDALRVAGAFQNPAMENAFPKFPPSADVPIAWAQVLQYVQVFRDGTVAASFDDNTLTTLPTIPATSLVGATGSGFAQGGTTLSGYCPLGAAGLEGNIQSGTGPGSWALVYTAQPNMSNVWGRAMNCVKYSQIGKVAPDASAYATPANQSSGGFVCFTPKFDTEIALLLSIPGAAGQAVSSPFGYYKPSPTLSGFHSAAFWFVENFQMCPYLPGQNKAKTLRQHAWNAATHPETASPTGRVVRRVYKDANPVRFLFGATMPIDTRCYQALIGQVMLAANPSGSYTAVQAYVIGVVAMSALIAKLLPYAYCSTLSTFNLNTAHDPTFSSLPMPVALAAILNSLGPIALDGRMMYPMPWGGADQRGGWLTFSTVGMVSNTSELYSNIFGGTNPGNLGLTVGNFPFTIATYPSSSLFPMTPVTSTPAFLTIWGSVWNQSSTPSENAAPLIKLDSHNPVGKANQLVIADVTLTGAGSNNANLPTVASAGTLRVVEAIVSQIGSFKCIIGDELGAAILVPVGKAVSSVGTLSTLAAINPPFRAPVGGANRYSGVSAFAMNCASAEVSAAIGVALANIKRETFAINGNTVDVSKNGDLFGGILDKIIAPIFGDGVAAGIKGSPIGALMRHVVPFAIGGPILYAADRLGVVDGVVSTFSTTSVGKAAERGLDKLTKAAGGVRRKVIGDKRLERIMGTAVQVASKNYGRM